jgi:predicted DNA-binding protein
LRNFEITEAMPTITCKIPNEVNAHLEAAARQRRVPKSQIVREALALSFRKSMPKVSAFDLMKDACGLIKGGPKDYTSHPSHLKGFGGA